MKFTQRFQNATKILLNQPPYQAIGEVVRNYSKGSSFNPQGQLRGITYKAIDKIGQGVSVYEPIVKRIDGTGYEQHPLYNIVAKPNSKQDGVYFHHLYAMLYEIYGETFWYLMRGEDTKKVKEIELLPPDRMELVVEDGELVGYILHKLDGTRVPFMPDEIIHDKRPNPFNQWRGISVLERASEYVDTEITTTRFTLNYMRNNASPSGIVQLPRMDREAFKAFAQQWREGYEGPENAGKTAFLRGEGVDFKAVGATLQDIDQKVTREMAKEDVLAMFDVPKGLLGTSGDKGLGRAELELLEYIFAKYKIDPMMERLDRIWKTIAMQLVGARSVVTVDHETTIPTDKEYELKQKRESVNKWRTPNEIRAEEGLEPIEGGDILDLGNKSPEPQRVIQESHKKIVLKKNTAENSVRKQSDEREEFRKEIMKTSDAYSTELKIAISTFSKKQEAKIIAAINASSKTFDEWLFNVKEDSEELALILIPIIIKLMEEQSAGVVNFITGEPLKITPAIQKEVEAHALRLSGNYNQETIKALQKSLAEGTANKESLAKLKKRVESTLGDAQGYRAERIARTESLRASNRTAELVYKQNGYKKVSWFTNPGACEFCQAYDGKVKEIGATYNQVGDVVTGVDGGQLALDYSDIDYPPLHPNCRCSLVPVE